VFLLVDQNPLKANEKCWNLHPDYGSQIIAAGCVGVFQTSHPWSKYRVIESPNLCANGTQMVQVLVVYSKGVPEMYIHDCNLNSHNQPSLSPSNTIEHVYIHFQAISMHYFSMLILSYFSPQYTLAWLRGCMTIFWSSNTWN